MMEQHAEVMAAACCSTQLKGRDLKALQIGEMVVVRYCHQTGEGVTLFVVAVEWLEKAAVAQPVDAVNLITETAELSAEAAEAMLVKALAGPEPVGWLVKAVAQPVNAANLVEGTAELSVEAEVLPGQAVVALEACHLWWPINLLSLAF